MHGHLLACLAAHEYILCNFSKNNNNPVQLMHQLYLLDLDMRLGA
jgi:hypothetical protein